MKRPKKADPLVAVLDRLEQRLNGIERVIARVIFPVEAMNELTGELRAIRHLLDAGGHYRFIDAQKAAAELAASQKPVVAGAEKS